MPELRKGRIPTERGDYGVKIQLRSMVSTNQVFWSRHANSYVVTEDGTIYSINGIGEIRWKVEDWNKDEDSNDARRYFLE